MVAGHSPLLAGKIDLSVALHPFAARIENIGSVVGMAIDLVHGAQHGGDFFITANLPYVLFGGGNLLFRSRRCRIRVIARQRALGKDRHLHLRGGKLTQYFTYPSLIVVQV